MNRWARVLRVVSLLAGMALVAQSEIQLALAVGWPAWLAWCAAVSLDGYVLAAVIARRGILPPVLVSAVSVLASHAVYSAPAAWESGRVGVGHLLWFLAAGCSVVPLLVVWRVHNLLEHPVPAPEPAPVPALVPAPVAAPLAEPAPAPVAALVSTPVPQGAPTPAGNTRETIAAHLEHTPATVADLRRLAGVSETAVRNHLDKLGAKRGKDGLYRLPVRRAS